MLMRLTLNDSIALVNYIAMQRAKTTNTYEDLMHQTFISYMRITGLPMNEQIFNQMLDLRDHKYSKSSVK